MVDDADNDTRTFDPLYPERVYLNYLETCRRLGIERCHASARQV